MKERLRGFRAVYSFTFKQLSGTKSFKIITVLIALLIAGGLIVGSVVGAGLGKDHGNGTSVNGEATEVSPVDNVLVMDESGLSPIDFSAYLKGNKVFENIQFKDFKGTDFSEAIKDSSVTQKTVILQIVKQGTDYQLKGALPENSLLSEKDVKKLVSALSQAFQLVKLNKAGLTPDQITAAMQPVDYTYSNIGDKSTNVATVIVKMVAPMLFSFMLYMMLILYGQSVSKSVSGEKTSKLVETLLVSVRPDALIAGKVVAVAVQGVMQFIIWIAALFIGLYGGDMVAKIVHPGYTNPVIAVLNAVKNNIGESALSPAAVLLAVAFFFVGFLFYSVLAALAGSMVSKPEDAASTQSILQLPIIISWLLCYFVPLNGNETFIPVARYIPFTAPFCVPVDTLTGAVNLWESTLMLMVMIVFTLLFVALSSRIFKGLILYNGQKVNLKTIQGILKGKQ